MTTSQSDSFRVLFEAIADEVGTIADTLIVTVDRQRIFPSTTPLALNLRFSAKLGPSIPDAFCLHSPELIHC